jgi:hypothetical protein
VAPWLGQRAPLYSAGWLSGWRGDWANYDPNSDQDYVVPADGALPPTTSLPPTDGAVCFDYGSYGTCYKPAVVRAVGCGAFDLWSLPPTPDRKKHGALPRHLRGPEEEEGKGGGGGGASPRRPPSHTPRQKRGGGPP